jgi:CAAX prenyl protease-like protein
MKSASSVPGNQKLLAYTLPMALFLGLLAIDSALKKIGGAFWLSSPKYWIYHTQSVLCAGLLLWFRRDYELGRFRRPVFVVATGVLVFVLWISPQLFFNFAPRTIGFNPNLFATQPTFYWLTVSLRFLRLVIVVPFVEEIFWRGFLLRFLIDDRFYRVPVGAFSWVSFATVSLAFGFAHSVPDWIAAIITGMIYNVVVYRTKSLISCVVVHAITNLLLGLWIMRTEQWGFW